MLIVRQVPGAGQFDPLDPASGLVELPAPASGDDTQWRILTAGYVSAGAPHDFSLQLTSIADPSQPAIILLSATAANSGTPCPVWIPRDPGGESWVIRFETTGKADLGTLSLNLAFLGVVQ